MSSPRKPNPPPRRAASPAPAEKPPAAPSGAYHVQLVITQPGGSQRQLEGDLTLTDLSVAAPVITTPPSSQIVREGEPVTLTVEATGTEPLAYQWAANGATIEGETAPALVDLPAEGEHVYEVRVTNAGGQAAAQATVAVIAPVAAPRIVVHPVGSVITAGQSATLTVQAIGTAPLSYQWFGDTSAVPGATSPSVTVTPAATTSFFCRVTNAGGTVDSAAATVTVQPNVVPIEGLGLTYRRKIGLPSLWAAYAYGDMTGRVVDGKVRLIFSGDVTQGSPIYELEIGEDQPVATLIQEWWDPYHGKRGTWITGALALETAAALQALYDKHHDPIVGARARAWRRVAARIPRDSWTWHTFGGEAVNGTHFYHAGLDLLFVGYGDTYNVSGRQDWTHVALRLHADGTTEAFGPWRFEMRDGGGYVRVGPFAAGSIREDPFTGSIMSNNTIGSGNSQYPWGPNCVSGAPFPTEQSPAGPDVPNFKFTDTWLYSYFMGDGSIDAVTGVASGPIRSARRKRDPYIFHGGQSPQTCVDPAKYQGVGSWTEVDSLGGIFPLADRLYFFASVLGSPIQDPANCLAAHGWYATGLNVPPFTCGHGCPAVPTGITGPVATAKFPACYRYAWDDLTAVKNTDRDWTPEPRVESNLTTDFGIVTVPEWSVGNARCNNAGFYNPHTRRYYTIAHAADRGEVTWGLVNAYIHEWDVA